MFGDCGGGVYCGDFEFHSMIGLFDFCIISDVDPFETLFFLWYLQKALS